jgi:NhaP-type Na+/H+ and K+/H+ antiporter
MIVNQQTISINTPAIQTSTTALASNPARVAWNIQNLDTGVLYVCLGGTASATVFHVVLKGGTGTKDGTGGTVGQEAGTIFTGPISVFSAGTPSYVVLEQ